MVRVAISTGDPAGIGPEICIKMCQHVSVAHPAAELHLFGDPALFPSHILNESGVTLHPRPLIVPSRAGVPSSLNGKYTAGLIHDAVEHIQNGNADALVTAPISKSVLYEAGFSHPGHTEYLGHLAGDVPTYMMIASPVLKVVPITLHQSLKSAIRDLTLEKIIAVTRATNHELKEKFCIVDPRIVICGLNPHAGENGTMGREEIEIIRPAIEQLRNEGININGPFPADTLFHQAARATYDCALGLYHDQVLIPAKALAFDTGVNLTIGLPFVRTSPDHGTAFDIAGQNKADPASMISAVELAIKLAA
ncbi:MAG: 4-hydroxythreonine-4-phosphate dehydrogenase PdxA [Alphaproteobacteria bacterium]